MKVFFKLNVINGKKCLLGRECGKYPFKTYMICIQNTYVLEITLAVPWCGMPVRTYASV